MANTGTFGQFFTLIYFSKIIGAGIALALPSLDPCFIANIGHLTKVYREHDSWAIYAFIHYACDLKKIKKQHIVRLL